MKSLEIINKIESKKVELGMNVELNALLDLEKLAGKIGGQILGLEMEILSNANDIKKLSQQYDSVIAKFKDFEIKAKELGIENIVNQAKESVVFYQEKIRRADKYLTTIQALTKR